MSLVRARTWTVRSGVQDTNHEATARPATLNNMPEKLKEEHPNNIIIIDCTELKIQCPSSLVLQSQSYSNYKSTNTLKSLVGVDPKEVLCLCHSYIQDQYWISKLAEEVDFLSSCQGKKKCRS